MSNEVNDMAIRIIERAGIKVQSSGYYHLRESIYKAILEEFHLISFEVTHDKDAYRIMSINEMERRDKHLAAQVLVKEIMDNEELIKPRIYENDFYRAASYMILVGKLNKKELPDVNPKTK